MTSYRPLTRSSCRLQTAVPSVGHQDFFIAHQRVFLLHGVLILGVFFLSGHFHGQLRVGGGRHEAPAAVATLHDLTLTPLPFDNRDDLERGGALPLGPFI